jgi:NADPH:quinone reductase-like Zn-dependent oxidoreductase
MSQFPAQGFSGKGAQVQENRGAVKGKALWYVAPGRGELRDEAVPTPKSGELQVRALFGAISRGTERLVHAGRVPASEYQRMRGPRMQGAFPFPVKYGYATVGTVESGPAEFSGRTVFTLHPHQDVFNMPAEEVFPLPAGVSPKRAVLAANMETALNALWDGLPAPCDRIAIVGGGLLGILTAYLCARLPGAQVTVLDVASSRRDLAQRVGARFACPPSDLVDCDIVFHASGTAAGLTTALRIAGDEASVVELSWYGAGEVGVALGEAFHSRRLRLCASQVGKVAPSHRARWSSAGRLAAALALLTDPVLDALIASPIEFDELPARLSNVFAGESDGVCPLIRYPAAAGNR